MTDPMQCRKCGKYLSIGRVWDDENVNVEFYNGEYGCDTSCEYVRFIVNCPCCGDSFETGAFGFFENDEERAEFLADFQAEYQR